MSLFDPQKGAGRLLRNILTGLMILCLAPVIAACGNDGFRPLHADLGGEIPAYEKFAALNIAPIPGRVGQQLRNELIYHTTRGGDPVPPQYRLDIAIQESVSSTLVQRTADALGEVYNLTASFTVIRLSDQKVMLTGTSNARAGYERVVATYANVRARRDAEDRAAKTVATDLKARISSFLGTSA